MGGLLTDDRGYLARATYTAWLGQLWRRCRVHLCVILIYTALTVLMTYPVVSRLSTHIAGTPGDNFEHLWILWWGKKAMWDLRTSMADLSYFDHPWGIYHPMLSATPLIQITTIPLVLLCGPVVAYNLFFLSTFVLTAYTTYLLCYDVTGSRWAAFVGGLIYGFAPTRMIHGLGHLAQITTYWFPLFALFALRFIRHPSIRNGFWAGLLMGLSALVNFVHTAHFVLIFALCWLVYVLVVHRDRVLTPSFLRATGLMFGVAALLTVPFLLPFFQNELRGTVHYVAREGASGGVTNPLSFLLPSSAHPLVKALGLSRVVAQAFMPNLVESWSYLGVLPVALAVVGAKKHASRARFWIFYGVVSIVLSLGPFLRIAGHTIVLDEIDGVKVYIQLPYILLRFVPLFKMSRTPARIAVGTPMALAVLVSLGMLQIQLWLRKRHWGLNWLLLVAFTAIVLFEYCAYFPYPTSPALVPAFYAQVRQEDGEFAIVDYPLNLDPSGNGTHFNRAMYYQTIHERPIAGGRSWRHIQEGTAMTRMVNALIAPSELDRGNMLAVERSDRERIAWLSAMGFRYLVQHKMIVGHVGQVSRDESQIALEQEHFVRWLSEPIYEDDAIVVYRVPDDLSVSSNVLPLSEIVYGWYSLEGESQETHRWLAQEGLILAHASERAAYRLAFDARAFEHPRGLTLLVNDDTVYTAKVGPQRRQFLSPVFELQPGLNELRFQASEPCNAPAEVSETSADERCLSVDFMRFSWEEPVQVPEPGIALAQFGEQLGLLDYDLDQDQVVPGDVIRLELRWDVRQSPERDYTLFAHVWSQENEFAGQWDSEPLAGAYPTSWLDQGEVIEDRIDIPIRQDAEAGAYMLLIGWYDRETGERLLLQDSPDATALALAPIVVLRE